MLEYNMPTLKNNSKDTSFQKLAKFGILTLIALLIMAINIFYTIGIGHDDSVFVTQSGDPA